jgi:two-component system chemotaxis response regulator CheB
MIKVLIVEDSRVVSEYLQYVLSFEPEISVIGNVSNGKAAIEFVSEHKPDVITMDVNMPIMNGLEATRVIMSTNPVPIIIVSGSQNTKDVAVSLEALAAGALSVVEKPAGIGHPQETEQRKKLISMIKLMAEVKVITRKPSKRVHVTKNQIPQKTGFALTNENLINRKIVAIGVSTGGPQVLQKIFSKLTSKFPCPILVVQHITTGFLEGLVTWLITTTKIPVYIATQNETMLPGHIYFAPNNYQMGVKGFGKIVLTENEANNGICPSVAHFFNSVEKEYGNKAIAIILTGMGRDGAVELKQLREAGALTIAQDKESALIYGMPGVAAEINAADFFLNTEQIAELLLKMENGIKSK